jgi:hypothetical protein
MSEALLSRSVYHSVVPSRASMCPRVPDGQSLVLDGRPRSESSGDLIAVSIYHTCWVGPSIPPIYTVPFADWKEEPTKALKDVNVYDAESLYPTKQLAPWANTPGSVVPPLTLLNPHPPPNRDD